MALQYDHLDDRTRKLMLEEIKHDLAANKLYISDNLSQQGIADYPDFLKAAASYGNDSTLAHELSGRLNSHEKPRQLKTGGFSKPPIMRVHPRYHGHLREGRSRP